MTDKYHHFQVVTLASLQIQNSSNEDVLLDSGLKVFDVIVNQCSKLHYEMLLK